MENKISISTGLVYKLTSNRDEMVDILRLFKPGGIEFCLAFPEYIETFDLNGENLDYVRSLGRVSIHGPWVGMNYGNNEKSKAVLKGLKKIVDLLDAANVNFDSGEISDFKIFSKADFPVTIENEDWRKKLNRPDDFVKIIKDNPFLNYNLDIAHAMTVDINDVKTYFDLFGDKISQIHLSYLTKELKDHRFIHNLGEEDRGRVIEVFKWVPKKIPVVLECVADDEKEVSWIAKEIDYLRSI